MNSKWPRTDLESGGQIGAFYNIRARKEVVVAPYAQHTDDTLCRMVAERDAEALSHLYDRYAPALYALLSRLVPDESKAGLLLEETFWQIWKRAPLLYGNAAVTVILIRIAREGGMAELRRQRPHTHFQPCLERAAR